MGNILRYLIPLLVGALLLFGCAETLIIGSDLDRTGLVDGVYEGSYSGGPNSVLVKVTIKDSTIVNIEIVRHRAWKGRKAESTILRRIIENQSTDVAAVTGATNSSRVIMNAVQKAIEKASEN